MSNELVTTALFGAGYTLRRVAQQLPRESIVLVCASSESAASLRSLGFRVEQLDCSVSRDLKDFFARYSKLEIFVDSVPPQADVGETLVEAIRQYAQSLRRIIYLSTTGVYGVEDGSLVTEDTRCNPTRARGQARLIVEERYRSLPISSCSFRIAAIYGPGRGIGHAIQSGRYVLIDEGVRWSNRIHVDDLSASIVAAISFQGLLPQMMNLADDNPTQAREIVEYYCRTFSFPSPPSISSFEAERRGLETMLSNQKISNALLRKVLQRQLAYPSFRDGALTEFS